MLFLGDSHDLLERHADLQPPTRLDATLAELFDTCLERLFSPFPLGVADLRHLLRIEESLTVERRLDKRLEQDELTVEFTDRRFRGGPLSHHPRNLLGSLAIECIAAAIIQRLWDLTNR